MKRKIITAILSILVIVTLSTVIIPPLCKDDMTTLAQGAVWYTEPMRKMYDSEGREITVDNLSYNLYNNIGYTYTPPLILNMEELENSIKNYISSRKGEWGVYIKNLNTGEYISINEKKYSAASLIKLFVAAAVYNDIAAGDIQPDEMIKSNLQLMLRESSNTACNYLTSRLGGGSAAAGFKAENEHTASLGCQNTSHMSEIVDGGRKITVLGTNQTSPADCGLILEKLHDYTLVSSEISHEMLDHLLNQERRWKIPAGIPEGVVVANKTGETSKTEGDAAVVYSPNCDYVICVIGGGDVGEGIETIRQISEMSYNFFNP